MLLAVALGRAVALVAVTRLRAAGFEMVWIGTDARPAGGARGDASSSRPSCGTAGPTPCAAWPSARSRRACSRRRSSPRSSICRPAHARASTSRSARSGWAAGGCTGWRSRCAARRSAARVSTRCRSSSPTRSASRCCPRAFATFLASPRGGRARRASELGAPPPRRRGGRAARAARPRAGRSLQAHRLEGERAARAPPGARDGARGARRRVAGARRVGRALGRRRRERRRSIARSTSCRVRRGAPPARAAIAWGSSSRRRACARGSRPTRARRTATLLAGALASAASCVDADRSELDELEVAQRVAEHARPLDPRGLADLRTGRPRRPRGARRPAAGARPLRPAPALRAHAARAVACGTTWRPSASSRRPRVDGERERAETTLASRAREAGHGEATRQRRARVGAGAGARPRRAPRPSPRCAVIASRCAGACPPSTRASARSASAAARWPTWWTTRCACARRRRAPGASACFAGWASASSRAASRGSRRTEQLRPRAKARFDARSPGRPARGRPPPEEELRAELPRRRRHRRSPSPQACVHDDEVGSRPGRGDRRRHGGADPPAGPARAQRRGHRARPRPRAAAGAGDRRRGRPRRGGRRADGRSAGAAGRTGAGIAAGALRQPSLRTSPARSCAAPWSTPTGRAGRLHGAGRGRRAPGGEPRDEGVGSAHRLRAGGVRGAACCCALPPGRSTRPPR